MQDIINQFKKIAPFIVEAVKARVTTEMNEEEVALVIHEEILAFFAKQQNMAAQHLLFSPAQRASFAATMFDLLKPLAEALVPRMNPLYEEYAARTGNTGALNFITKRGA